MESLLDDETKLALIAMAKPLKDRLEHIQNKVSDTRVLLEKLQIKLIGGDK